ncbi:MAG TPA: hypothetical protein VFA03_16285 [Acetobacteraceae bacterium]|nr:hypothetical protein [Acetobacteraceae bacterium]
MTTNRACGVLAAVAGSALAGCTAIYQGTAPPVVAVSNPFGAPLVLNRPPGPPPPPPAADLNGAYSGTAFVLDTGGGVCVQNRPVRDFLVHDHRVRWLGFRGRIAPDGELQMVYGTTWVYGQFVGDRFQGQISFMGGRNFEGNCTYIMELRRSPA